MAHSIPLLPPLIFKQRGGERERGNMEDRVPSWASGPPRSFKMPEERDSRKPPEITPPSWTRGDKTLPGGSEMRHDKVPPFGRPQRSGDTTREEDPPGDSAGERAASESAWVEPKDCWQSELGQLGKR